ncbi:MAG: hypothetical protein H6736_13405 [Alphaproteobacteria bacterium]|nr:hypothetical protein [Alphaproteobacteria bacterium]MCB9692801.1 hypothetical protein [Alphaproteobacteria bacterium]
MLLMMLTAHATTFEILEGARPTRDLHVAVNTRKATIAKCFASTPGPAKLHVTVGADGLVTDAKYSMSAGTDPAMLQCLYSEALKLRLVPNQDSGPTTYVWMASLPSLDDPLDPEGPKPGQLWVNGSLTEQQVRTKLDQNRQQFDFCARKARTASVPVPDVVVTKFTIAADGKVTAASADGNPDLFSECVVGRVQGLTFDKPTTPTVTEVVYPIGFATP